MNKILGFMNVLLITLFLIMLLVGAGGFEQKNAVLGVALAFIPITFAMFALEPQARFLRTAIAMNAVFVALLLVSFSATAGGSASIFILPFALNVAGLTRIWFRVRHERREAEYESAGEDPRGDLPATAAYEEEPARNYFVRHWRGQLSLPVSYWVNVWGATAVCFALIFASQRLLQNASLRGASIVALALNALLIAGIVWSTLGTWRSAGHHVARGGSSIWAVAAQVLVVLAAVANMTNFFVYTLPQVKEHWLIASNRDPIGHIDAQLSRNEQALVLRGPFGAGAASEVKSLLDQSPAVATVVLESEGGRLGEAVRIAKLVRERQLNTYVETHCESACTFVFLAGTDRAATQNARIGFHRAFFPGMSPDLDRALTANMLEKYRAAGLSDGFLSRVGNTKAQDMWYPTHDELIEAHVVSRASSGGEQNRLRKYDSKAYLAFQYGGDPIMGAINDHFHGAVDEAAAAAWAEYKHGANDAAMWAAARKVILSYYRKLQRTADESSLRAYLQIRLDELRAARKVSEQACALSANSGLDMESTLPKELYVRELTWVQRAIASSDQPAAPAVDAQQFSEVMQRLAERLSPEVPQVVRDPSAYMDRPDLLCRATLEFYEGVRGLTLTERTIALRGLFQGAEK